MSTFIALLRGINVGGNRRIKMADLKETLADAGIADTTTLLQSGNVIAQSNADVAAFTDIVETSIETRFGFRVDVITRTATEFLTLQNAGVFTPTQLETPKLAHVAFLKTTPVSGGFEELRRQSEGEEELTLVGTHLFLYYGEGSARSGLSNAVIERALGTPATSRNWNTVSKIATAIS